MASLLLQREAGEDLGVTVTYQETTDGQGETTYSVGVEMPNDMDLDLELEFEEPAGAPAFATLSATSPCRVPRPACFPDRCASSVI